MTRTWMRWVSGCATGMALLAGIAACSREPNLEEMTPAERSKYEMEQRGKALEAKLEEQHRAQAAQLEEDRRSGKLAERRAQWDKNVEAREQRLHAEGAAHKRLAIDVAEGRRPPPTATEMAAPTAQPSPVVDGKCPAYEQLPVGASFIVSETTGARYQLKPGNYKLDAACRPVSLSTTKLVMCGSPFYGFQQGDALRIEPGEEKYFGYPPGEYTLSGQCEPTIEPNSPTQIPFKLRDAAYREGDQRLERYREEDRAAAKARQEAQRARGEPETLPPQRCNPPLQAHGPGSIAIVNRPTLPAFPMAGSWWISATCQARWFKPAAVMEPAATAKKKGAEEQFRFSSSALLAAIGTLVLLLIVAVMTKRITGRSLWQWLRGQSG